MANNLSIPDKYKGKKIYSYSKLSGLKECEYAYYLQRIKKIKGKDNAWNLNGSLVHDIIEELQQGKITNEEAKSKFIEGLEINKMVAQFPTEQMENNYVKALLSYFEGYKPYDCKKFHIEKKEFLKLGDRVLIMFLDLITQSHDGTITIYDHKTSSKFSKKDLKEKARQLILYAYTLKQNYKKVNDVKIAFNMVKYYEVKHHNKGRSKIVDRSKLVAGLKDKVEKDLIELGLSELEINEIILKALIDNKIPNIVVDNFQLNPYLLYIEYGEEDEEDLINWINKNAEEIENKLEWNPKELNVKEEFWCQNLCGVSEHCKYWKEYQQNKENGIIEEDNLF